MGDGSLWTMIGYPLIFCTPWVLAIAWLVRRTAGGDGTPARSMGEIARSRMNLP